MKVETWTTIREDVEDFYRVIEVEDEVDVDSKETFKNIKVKETTTDDDIKPSCKVLKRISNYNLVEDYEVSVTEKNKEKARD